MSYNQELPFHELSDTSPEMPSNGQKRAQSEDDIENPLPRPAKQQKNALDSPVNSQISRLQRENYTVGWICALHIEMAAARAMLDSVHDSPPTSPNDSNAYTLGSIGPHNIVMACLPTSFYGTNNAANVASNMARSFPAIRVCLLVGIGGGVPGDIDMRLGDIVVGCKVMQYDLGKVIGDGLFTRTCIPRIPPQDVLRSISLLRSNHEMKPSRVSSILEEMQTKRPEMAKYACSNHLQDRLFHANYAHDPTKPNCNECADSMQVIRALRTNNDPKIHYGGIASGNQVMKDGITRDRIVKELDVICFEMEAAGLTDHFPCLVIRGICDYSDSHKNKEWQEYSAACAAAYAKELLEVMPTRRADVLIDDKGEEALRCRRDLFLTNPLEDRQVLKRKLGDRVHGTCAWITATEQFRAWMSPGQMARSESQKTNALWLHGNPGTGKSTMAIFLSEWLSNSSVNHGYTLAYFFCDSGFNKRNTATSIIRGLLWQLVDRHPQLVSHILPKYRERGPEVFKSFDALWPIFVAAAADQNTGRKYCIIDALDECDEESQNIILRQFQEAFQRRDASLNIKLLVTSRPYPVIQKVQGQVRSILQDKAEGTFLWIGLACEELRQRPSNQAIKLLQSIPRGLQSLYKKLLDKACQGSEAETVQRILSMVIKRNEIIITEKVVKAAARTGAGKGAIELLLNEYGDEITITEEIVKAAANNWNQEVFIFLLSQRGNKITITEEVVKAAVQNWNKEVFKFLLRQREHEITITEEVFSSIRCNFNAKEVMKCLLNEQRDEITITERITSIIASDYDAEMMALLMYYQGDQIIITEEVIRAAAGNHNNGRRGAMALLLDKRRKDLITITEEAIPAIALWCNKEVMELLLEGRGDEITITQEVAEAAAGNVWKNGHELMKFLLHERGEEITITEEVIKAAAGNVGNGKGVVEILLSQRGH
ncbi:hypothetical protein ACQKWADRAFT_311398 [Trichoderma austrokoningii]